jgi:predicted membrane channel-forming protein YqfA (hemolysin III family)
MSVTRLFYVIFSLSIVYGLVGIAMCAFGPQPFSVWTLVTSVFVIVSSIFAILSLRRLQRAQATIGRDRSV